MAQIVKTHIRQASISQHLFKEPEQVVGAEIVASQPTKDQAFFDQSGPSRQLGPVGVNIWPARTRLSLGG
jgi:hypothetical protein